MSACICFPQAYARLAAVFLGVCLALSFNIPSRAEPHKYVVDPDHLSIGFLVTHIGYAKTLGMFREARGEFTFDEVTGTLSNVRITVDTDSVFTNHEKRDKHLRGEDFLHTVRFPQMIFTAETAQSVGEQTFRVTGELTLHGKTNPLTLDVTWNKSAAYPFRVGLFKGKTYVLGASARGVLTRSDSGMTSAVDNGWVSVEVDLIIEFEAQRQ
jgi:polyisoprenoid-binding protein YceI